MELFSEIYGLYYRLTAEILRLAPLSRQQIQDIIVQSGFAESTLQLLPKLLNEQTWQLLTEKDGLWYSRLHNPPQLPLTTLELRFLKAVINDKRAGLFLSDEQLAHLNDLLSDVAPLYSESDFHYFDRFSDGDPYTDATYRHCFHQLLEALHTQTPCLVTYDANRPHSRQRQLEFLPLHLEYSVRDDKFRLHGLRLQNGQPLRSHTLNLGRVIAVEICPQPPEQITATSDNFPNTHAHEPLVVSVTDERNAIERFHLEFSTYEKQSVYDDATQTAIVTIYYPVCDETELLIRLLSFGPVLQVLGPAHIVEQIHQRLSRQKSYLPPPDLP